MCATGYEIEGWSAPAAAIILGLLALPLMFIAPMSFVIALAVASAASMLGVIVLTDARPTPQRLAGAFAVLSLPLALALLVVPFLLQD